MNEKERQNQLRDLLSLNIVPRLKQTKRKVDTLLLLNLVGIVVLVTLVSVSIALILIQGV